MPGMRWSLCLVFVSACVESSPASTFQAQLMYAGVPATVRIEFPEHSFADDPTADDPPILVPGTVEGGTPISRATLRVDDDTRVYELVVLRRDDDDYRDEPNVVCKIPAVELGHAVPCLYSRLACSVVLVDIGTP